MSNTPFIMIDDEDSHAPLYRQIYEAVRRAVLSGEFEPRMRLPATRQLAQQLGVSRMTVVNAYEQLLAEGYLEGRTGAGTFVASTLPEAMLRVEQDSPAASTGSAKPRNHSLSRRGEWLASVSVLSLRVQADGYNRAFQNGMPAVDEFPFRVWSQLASRRLRNPPRELLRHGRKGYLYRDVQ